MTTDFRALCAELLAWADKTSAHYYTPPEVLVRARAALAEPEPVGPTDEAWTEFIEQLRRVQDVALCEGLGPRFDLAEFATQAWRGRLASSPESPQPVPVSERLPEPGVKVLAHYLNGLGKGRTICAIWVPAKSRADHDDLDNDDFFEYNEEDDKFYWPEGWYEAIENWDDLGWVKVYEGEVVYWQPLPQWPARALPLPGEVDHG